MPSPPPALISPVAPRRAQTIATFGLDRADIDLSEGTVRRRLTLVNHQPTILRGTLALRAPAGWRMTPRRIAIDLRPGEALDQPLTLVLPANQAIGEQPLSARLLLGEHKTWLFKAPRRVVSPNLQFSALSRIEGGMLKVWTRIVNRGGEPMFVRAGLITAGRPPVDLTIGQLLPGQAVIRVGVEQLDGPHRCHVLLPLERPKRSV
jgi:hypothetical protein